MNRAAAGRITRLLFLQGVLAGVVKGARVKDGNLENSLRQRLMNESYDYMEESDSFELTTQTQREQRMMRAFRVVNDSDIQRSESYETMEQNVSSLDNSHVINTLKVDSYHPITTKKVRVEVLEKTKPVRHDHRSHGDAARGRSAKRKSQRARAESAPSPSSRRGAVSKRKPQYRRLYRPYMGDSDPDPEILYPQLLYPSVRTTRPERRTVPMPEPDGGSDSDEQTSSSSSIETISTEGIHKYYD